MVIETAVIHERGAPAEAAGAQVGAQAGAQVGAQQAAPLLRRVRRDALPEEIQYRDDGCDIHPHCLTCPLPRCRYDEPGGVRAMLNAYRDQQIVALRYAQGVPVDQIAERYGLSRRTVFRVLSTSPRAAPDLPTGQAGRSG